MSDVTQPTEDHVTSGTGTGEASPGETSASMNDELATALRQRDEFQEQLLRSRAEFSNYQKRSKTQAEADRVYAVGSLVRDLLDGIDNLERATGALRDSAASNISEGLDMVHKQLLATLAKHGVEPIVALGKPFDPNEHEALAQQPDAQQPEGTVIAELSKGYRIRDRVLRPTKVAVSVKPASN